MLMVTITLALAALSHVQHASGDKSTLFVMDDSRSHSAVARSLDLATGKWRRRWSIPLGKSTILDARGVGDQVGLITTGPLGSSYRELRGVDGRVNFGPVSVHPTAQTIIPVGAHHVLLMLRSGFLQDPRSRTPLDLTGLDNSNDVVSGGATPDGRYVFIRGSFASAGSGGSYVWTYASSRRPLEPTGSVYSDSTDGSSVAANNEYVAFDAEGSVDICHIAQGGALSRVVSLTPRRPVTKVFARKDGKGFYGLASGEFLVIHQRAKSFIVQQTIRIPDLDWRGVQLADAGDYVGLVSESGTILRLMQRPSGSFVFLGSSSAGKRCWAVASR